MTRINLNKTKMQKKKNKSIIIASWKEKIICFLLLAGSIGFLSLYENTDFPPLKWIGSALFAVFSFFLFLIAVIFSAVIVFAFLCLIPSLRKKFGVEDQFSSGELTCFLYYMIGGLYVFGDGNQSLASIGIWMGIPIVVAWVYEKLSRLIRKG